VRGGDPRLIHRLTDPVAADGQRYASPDASICEARANACVSIYSRIFVARVRLELTTSAL